MGLVEDETQALRVVKLALEVDLMLGARLAGEVRKEFQVKTIEIVSGLEVTELIKYELLGISKSEFAAKYLIKALDDKDSNVRYYAISQLKYVIGLDEVISLVIEALEDKELNVRESAITELHSIAKIHTYNIVDILINILQFNKFPDIRSKAIFILDYYRIKGHIRANDGLIMALQDEDLYVRYCAASCLKHFRPLENIDYSQIDKIIEIYDERNFEYYIEIDELNKEYDKESEAAAIYIDYTLTDIYYGFNDDYNMVENFLRDTLQDEDQHIRNAAIEELVKIDNSMAVDILISALQHTDLSIHNKAALALKNNASSNILSQMWQMLLSDTFNTKDIILRIQNRCHYYNHEIFHSPPIEDNNNSQPSQIINDFRGANIGNVAHNVRGNQQVNPPQ